MLVAFLLFLVAGFASWRLLRGPATTVPGAEALFELQTLDGHELSQAEFSGRVLLVDFWATWCRPCDAQTDILNDIYETVGDKGVEFFAVSLGEEEQVVRQFVQEHPVAYPVLLDPQEILGLRFGIYALPTVVIFDADGEVTYMQPGVSDKSSLRQALIEAGIDPQAS